MRTYAAKLFLALLLLSPVTALAQTSGAPSAIPSAEKNKAIAVLVERVKAGEEEIVTKSARIDALEAQVSEMERSGKNLSDAYRSALLELGELRGEVKHLRDATDELKANLDEAKAARDKAQGEVKSLKSENRKLKAALSVVVLLGVRLLL